MSLNLGVSVWVWGLYCFSFVIRYVCVLYISIWMHFIHTIACFTYIFICFTGSCHLHYCTVIYILCLALCFLLIHLYISTVYIHLNPTHSSTHPFINPPTIPIHIPKNFFRAQQASPKYIPRTSQVPKNFKIAEFPVKTFSVISHHIASWLTEGASMRIAI